MATVDDNNYKMIRLPLVKTGQFALLICSIIFTVIPTVFIILRLIARRIAKRKLDAADHFIMGAWVCSYPSLLLFILYASVECSSLTSFPLISPVDDGWVGNNYYS